jgi:hypothetical protein
MADRWHILREGRVLTLARHLPPRFDVAAETVLPRANARRLAHQVRQDMWRALQNLRGFSPVVRVEDGDRHMTLIAGGRVSGRAPADTNRRIANVLEAPANRARWLRHAGEAR